MRAYYDSRPAEVRYYTRQQLRQIYDAIDRMVRTGRAEELALKARKGPKLVHGPEFRLLCRIMEWTGARVSEALALRPIDIRWDIGDSGVACILTLKKRGRKVIRHVPLKRALRVDILRFMKQQGLAKGSTARLFSCSRSVVMKYCTRLQHVLGFEVRTHFFRHTFAIRSLMWSRHGVPLNVLQKWLGHTSIVNTSIYTDIGAVDTSRYMRWLR